MNSKFVPYHSVMELNWINRYWINRYRRNKRRKLVRRWHGKLRRNDDRIARIAEQKWISEWVTHCNCQPPHDCPRESVLCGGLCELAGREPYFDEEDDA